MTDHPGRYRSSALLISQLKRANSQSDRQTDRLIDWLRGHVGNLCSSRYQARWIRKVFGHVKERLKPCLVGKSEGFQAAQHQAGRDWASHIPKTSAVHYDYFSCILNQSINQIREKCKNLGLASLVYDSSRWWTKRHQQMEVKMRHILHVDVRFKHLCWPSASLQAFLSFPDQSPSVQRLAESLSSFSSLLHHICTSSLLTLLLLYSNSLSDGNLWFGTAAWSSTPGLWQHEPAQTEKYLGNKTTKTDCGASPCLISQT